MLNEKEALRAAEYLRKWCKGHACGECIFYGGNCAVGYTTPANWVLPKPRRWSDADMALASALIKNGYEMISSVNNEIFSITGREVDEIYLRNGTFFKPFKPGEIVMLEDIVKEGKQK